MQQKLPALLFLAGTILASPAWSVPVTLTATDDTYISQHGGLGGPNATHGADTSLFAIFANGGNPAFRSYPLVQFDLSALAGETVTGPVTFEMFVQGTAAFPQFTRQVSVHQVLIPWDGGTATFNNFGAAPDVQFGSDVTAALDTIPVDYPAPGNRYVSWSLSADLVQGWIDDPSTNHGLLLFNQELQNVRDLQFGSLETANAPLLSFSVPEPSTLALLVVGVLGAGWRARRRAS